MVLAEVDMGLRHRRAQARVGQCISELLRCIVEVHRERALALRQDCSGFTGAQTSNFIESGKLGKKYLRVGARKRNQEQRGQRSYSQQIAIHRILPGMFFYMQLYSVKPQNSPHVDPAKNTATSRSAASV